MWICSSNTMGAGSAYSVQSLKKNMRIYRWEKDGIGPYNYYNPYDEEATKLVDKLGARHQDVETHPNIDRDFDEQRIEEYRRETRGLANRYIEDPVSVSLSGFKSLGQMRKWFSKEERCQLRECGFNLIQYEVDPRCCLISSHQVLFLPSNITEK